MTISANDIISNAQAIADLVNAGVTSKNINQLPVKTSLDPGADYAHIWDASAGEDGKALLNLIGGGSQKYKVFTINDNVNIGNTEVVIGEYTIPVGEGGTYLTIAPITFDNTGDTTSQVGFLSMRIFYNGTKVSQGQEQIGQLRGAGNADYCIMTGVYIGAIAEGQKIELKAKADNTGVCRTDGSSSSSRWIVMKLNSPTILP